jgi:hypothetical protein
MKKISDKTIFKNVNTPPQKKNPREEKKKRKGKERKGKERKGKGREGKERKGKERKGKERKGKERKGKERKGKERKGKENTPIDLPTGQSKLKSIELILLSGNISRQPNIDSIIWLLVVTLRQVYNQKEQAGKGNTQFTAGEKIEHQEI